MLSATSARSSGSPHVRRWVKTAPFDLLSIDLDRNTFAIWQSLGTLRPRLIRDDLVGDHFRAPFTAENHYEPIRYFLHGKDGYRRDIAD